MYSNNTYTNHNTIIDMNIVFAFEPLDWILPDYLQRLFIEHSIICNVPRLREYEDLLRSMLYCSLNWLDMLVEKHLGVTYYTY